MPTVWCPKDIDLSIEVEELRKTPDRKVLKKKSVWFLFCDVTAFPDMAYRPDGSDISLFSDGKDKPALMEMPGIHSRAINKRSDAYLCTMYPPQS